MEPQIKANLDTQLKSLRLATMLANYEEVSQSGARQNYTYEQFLLHLCEMEVDHRFNERIKELIKQAKLPKQKLLSDYDFNKVEIKKEAILQICSGDFLLDHQNIVFFGTPGSGKTHLAIAIGRELCLKGYKVVFYTCCMLIQELVKAKNNLTLTNFFKKMLAYDLVILDELGYIPFEKTESELLFQFISDRYERKSLLVTTNMAFSEWDMVFKDKMIATATIDRLVHYSQIFNFESKTKESYRTEEAKKRLKKSLKSGN
jgi:DNA replication protein DnaC